MLEPEPRISVAVACIVLDRYGRVLLVKHSEAKRGEFWFGKWIPPGGRLELGESLAEGAVREVKEETNLNVRVSGEPIVFDRIVREGFRTRLHTVYVNYVTRLATGQLEVGSDAGSARWFSRKELLNEQDELHEDTWRLLRKIRHPRSWL